MAGARAGEPRMALHHTGPILARAPVRRGKPDEEIVLLIGPDPGTKLFIERSYLEGAMVREYETGARKISLMLGPLEVSLRTGAES